MQTSQDIVMDWAKRGAATEEAPVAPAPQKSGFLRRALGDTAVSALKGSIGLPETFVGLADVATGGMAGDAAEAMGVNFKKAKEIANQWYSPEYKEVQRKVNEATGFVDTIKTMVQNPSSIIQSGVESAPSMLSAAGIGRGLLKTGLTKSAGIAGGLGEGLTTTGQQAEAVRQETGDVTMDDIGNALASGGGTALLGVLGAKVANKLGIGDVDTILAGGIDRGVAEGLGAKFMGGDVKKGILRNLVEAGLVEGIAEELPQSMQEQVFQNLSLGKPWHEGVGQAGAQGALVGMGMGAMGGGYNAVVQPAKIEAAANVMATPIATDEQGAFDPAHLQARRDAAASIAEMVHNELGQEAVGNWLYNASGLIDRNLPITFDKSLLTRKLDFAQPVSADSEVTPLPASKQIGYREIQAPEITPAPATGVQFVASPEQGVEPQRGLEPMTHIGEPAGSVQTPVATPENQVVDGEVIPEPKRERVTALFDAVHGMVKQGKDYNDLATHIADSGVNADQLMNDLNELGYNSLKEYYDRVGKLSKTHDTQRRMKDKSKRDEAFAAKRELELMRSGMSATEKQAAQAFENVGKQDQTQQLEGPSEPTVFVEPTSEVTNPQATDLEQAKQGAIWARNSIEGGDDTQAGTETSPASNQRDHAARSQDLFTLAKHPDANPAAVMQVLRNSNADMGVVKDTISKLGFSSVGEYVKQVQTLHKEAKSLAKAKDPNLIARRNQVNAELDNLASGKESSPRYSKVNPGRTQPLTIPQVKAAIADAVKALPADVQAIIEVVNDPSAFWDGVFVNGKVKLNAAQLYSPSRAREVLLDHELRHMGLSRMFGGPIKLAEAMQKAFAGRENEVAQFALSRGYTSSIEEAVEEWLVSKAKEAKDAPLIAKVVAVFRRWLRGHGFGGLNFSNSEMIELISRSGTEVGVDKVGRQPAGEDTTLEYKDVPVQESELPELKELKNEEVTASKRMKAVIANIKKSGIPYDEYVGQLLDNGVDLDWLQAQSRKAGYTSFKDMYDTESLEARHHSAYHGAISTHDKFDMSKVGTGRGMQIRGHGLYFSGQKEVAEHYRDSLKSKNGGKGFLYTVELAPELTDYLDWDKPLSLQSTTVKNALKPLLGSAIFKSKLGDVENPVGMRIYKTLETILGGDKPASEYLYDLGIRGNKYLNSEESGDNFVIFDDRDVEIIARYSKVKVAGKETLIPPDNLIEDNLKISQYSMNDKYKCAMTMMHPDDFLSLAADGGLYLKERVGEYKEFDENKMLGLPTFYVNPDTGKIEGHEGRARMTLMGKAGIQSTPVVLFNSKAWSPENPVPKRLYAESDGVSSHFMPSFNLIALDRSVDVQAVKDWMQLKHLTKDTRYSKPWFSKMQEVFETKLAKNNPDKPLPSTHYLAILKDKGIKQDEIVQSGIESFLKERDKATPNDVLGELSDNALDLQDEILGDGKEDTHYQQYVEPGAKDGSYREMFVTVPYIPVKFKHNGIHWISEDGKSRIVETEDGKFHASTKIGGVASSYGEFNTLKEAQYELSILWKDGHYPYEKIDNPVVRIRFNERVVGDKFKLERDGETKEVQTYKEMKYLRKEGWSEVSGVDGERVLFVEEMQGPSNANQQKMPEFLRKRIYDLGVKRVLSYAKEKGFDRVAWTTGEQQADRYDLSKQIDKVEAFALGKGGYNIFAYDADGTRIIEEREIPESKLSDYVGKDLAKKIIDQPLVRGDYTGLDLKVGGEGLTKLYDKTLPALFKKYGGEPVGVVDTGSFEALSIPITDKTPDSFARYSAAWHGSPAVHNKFSMNKVGTGEGIQAYGYGLYFASRREVAEHYREQLAGGYEVKTWRIGSSYLIKGGSYQDYSPQQRGIEAEAKANFIESLLIREGAVKEAFATGGLDAARAEMLRIATEELENYESYFPEIVPSYKKLIPAIKSATFDAKELGALYHVELTPKEDEYLLWDEPLSKQSDKVQSAVEKYVPEYKVDRQGWLRLGDMMIEGDGKSELTGRDIYMLFKMKEGGGKDGESKASKFLHSVGIRGIKYLDGGSRADGEGSYNYVVFNDKDIEIIARYSKPGSLLDKLGSSFVGKTFETTNNLLKNILPRDRMYDKFILSTANKPILDLLKKAKIEEIKQIAKQNVILDEMNDIKDTWVKSAKEHGQLDKVNEFAATATLWGIHGDKSFADQEWDIPSWISTGMQERTGLTLKAAHTIVHNMYTALHPDVKKAYKSLVSQMKSLREQDKSARIEFINNLKGVSVEKKAKLIDRINKFYNTIKGPYLPLGRFGKYAVQVVSVSKSGDRTIVFNQSVDTDYEARKLSALMKVQYGDGYKIELLDTRNIFKRDRINITMDFIDKVKAGLAAKSLSQAKRTANIEIREYLNSVGIDVDATIKNGIDNIKASTTMSELTTAVNKLASIVDDQRLNNEALVGIADALKQAGLDEETRDAIHSEFEDLFLSSQPESSTYKNSISRKGIAGFEKDMLRSAIGYADRHAKSIAYLLHGSKVDSAYRDMNDRAKQERDGGNIKPEQALTIFRNIKDLQETRQNITSEKVSPVVSAVNKLAFFKFLTSPSTFVVQSTQPWTITLPNLAAKFGFTKALGLLSKYHSAQLTGGYANSVIETFDQSEKFKPKGWNPDDSFSFVKYIRFLEQQGRAGEANRLLSSLTPGEVDLFALKRAMLDGSINVTQSHEAREYLMGGGKSSELTKKLANGFSWFMQTSELTSRKAAFLAAFQCARSTGKSIQESVISANQVIRETLYDYSQLNRPKMLTGNIGRLVGQFRVYQVQTISHLINLGLKSINASKLNTTPQERAQARKELTYIALMNFMFAGAAGVPLSGSAVALLGMFTALFSTPDDPFDFLEEAERAILETEGGKVVLKGLPMLIGMDISKRVGMGGIEDIISGEPPEKANAVDRANWYAAKILGPGYNVVSSSLFGAMEGFKTGKWNKAMQAVLPKPMADVARAWGLNENGVKDYTGTVVIPADQVSVGELALMAAGVNPSRIAVTSQRSRTDANVNARIESRQKALRESLYDAIKDQDHDGIQSAVDDIVKFNINTPIFALKVSDLKSGVLESMKRAYGVVGKQSLKLDLARDSQG